MKQLSDCTKIEDGHSFSRQESGITFLLRSDKKFSCRIVDIDKCVLDNVAVRRCDWLFLVDDKAVVQKPKAYYIELKGINIDEASEQLFNAIDRTKAQISNHDIEARVVSIKGSQPEILNSEYYRKVKRLIKKDIEFCKVHRKNRFTHVEKI